MAQHFLQSKARRTLNVEAIERMTDVEASAELRRLHWGDGDEQICPRCKMKKQHYKIPARNQWRCRDCKKPFSLTSGTIFSAAKLPPRKLLRIILELTKRTIGISAIELSVILNCQYKTAWVWLQKMKDALYEQRDKTPLEGDIHIDGAYICFHVRPKNRLSERIDRRLKRNQNPKKRCVLAMRQLASISENMQGVWGATRSITSIIKAETQEDILTLCARYIKPGSRIFADENPAYDPLHAYYETYRVNHQEGYVSPEGYTNNQAESFHARLRRLQRSVVHHFWGKHAHLYANQVAYNEDTRRWDTLRIYEDIVRKCMTTGPSRDFRGYWRGNKVLIEQLGV